MSFADEALADLQRQLEIARSHIDQLTHQLHMERGAAAKHAELLARELRVTTADKNRALQDADAWRSAAHPNGLATILERARALEIAAAGAREARRILSIGVGETPLAGAMARYVPALALSVLVNGLAPLDALDHRDGLRSRPIEPK